MARVFLSHSSKDKVFVRQLAEDLNAMGHQPWLDEWEIKVGECIVTKVEGGIENADFVVLVMTPNAVESGWVDREWKAKYWTEIEARKTQVLPVLLQDCKVPLLLHTRKYADFRTRYPLGFHQLVEAIGVPIVEVRSAEPANLHTDKPVTDLLAKLHSRAMPLAACFAEALGIAAERDVGPLRVFCERELGGYQGVKLDESSPDFPRYRLVQTFYSVTAQVNMDYFAFHGGSIIDTIARDPEHFFQLKTLMPQPVSECEGMAADAPKSGKGVLHWTRALKELVPEPKGDPDRTVWFYARGDTFKDILEAARAELTRRLLALLPSVEAPSRPERRDP